MKLPQGLTDTGNFHARSLTSISQRVFFNRIHGNQWAVLPYLRQRVEVGTKCNTTLFPKISNQFPDAIGGIHHTVDADLHSSTTLLANPLCNGRRTLHFLFHQLEFRILQLICCSQEITGVSPKGSRRQSHHCRACRAVKTRNKLAPFPMIRHIFTLMRISTWKDEGRKMFTTHHLP